MARTRKASGAKLQWLDDVLGTEGAPVLVADAAVYRRWRGGTGTAPTDYDRVVLEGGYRDPADVVPFDSDAIALMDSDGGGPVAIGWNEDELIVLMCDGDYDEDETRKARLLKAIASRKYAEYIAGELSVAKGVVVADSALVGTGAEIAEGEPSPAGANRFFVPRPQGIYVLLEGQHEEQDGSESRWCRLLPKREETYQRRPEEPERDPVAEIVDRLSFADPKQEARALESAIELVQLGRPDLALDICAKASPDRHVLVAWTRVLALAAQGDPSAAREGIALAESWLSPAGSPLATNQTLSRADVLRALDAVLDRDGRPDVQSARARVAAAPEPEVFIPEGDAF
jgi:hypothetical protein